MLVTLVFSVALPTLTLATSVDNIKAEEAKVKQKGEALSQEINGVIEVINQKYQEVAELDEEILNSQAEIKKTEADIADTQDTIGKRTDVVAKRLQEMQIREASNSSLDALLGAESFSDFINRAYAYTVLQNAEKGKIEALYSEQEKLAALEEKLVQTEVSLKKKQAVAKSEKESLDDKVAGLQTKLQDNAAVLSDLTAQRVEQENAIREAAIAKEAERQRLAAEEAAKENTTTTTDSSGTGDSKGEVEFVNNQNNGGQTTPAKPTPPVTAPVTPPSSNSFAGQATAYVATGNNTATGTVPTPGRTIAVDPNLIPLGSAVRIDVPGAPRYSGVYIAEDTGGVVKGAIIDVFVAGHGEALQFGRQSITITVL